MACTVDCNGRAIFQMPEMSSLEFLDALKQKSIRVPVIMVGSAPPEELVGESGSCHYIHMSGDESISDEVMDAVRQFSA